MIDPLFHTYIKYKIKYSQLYRQNTVQVLSTENYYFLIFQFILFLYFYLLKSLSHIKSRKSYKSGKIHFKFS